MELKKLQLGEICNISGGFGFPHSHQGRKNEKYPFYKVGDMNTGGNETYMITHNHSVSEGDIKALKAKIFPAGTIIFPKIGAAIATNKKRILSTPSTVDNNVMVLIPNEEMVTTKYLFYFLQDFDLKDWSNKSALPSIRKSDVEKTEIRLPFTDGKPDLAEQKRITDKLDKVFMEIEKSIDKIRQNRKYAGKTTYSELLTTFSDENLKTYSLEEVCDTTSGGTPSRSNSAYYDGDISWLKSGELNDNRSISSSEEHISEDAIKKSNAKVFPSGTVLLAMYGATVGKLGILSASASTNQAVCAITPHKNILNEYMFWYLFFYRDELVKKAFGGAQPNISQTLIRKLPVKIPLKDKQPDLAKQKEIVAKVSSIQEKQEMLTDLFSRQEKLFTSLRSSVLSQSFQMQT